MEKNNNKPKLRFPGFTDPWEQCKILEQVEKVLDYRGKSPTKFGMSWGDSGYLVLSALNVKNGYIDKSVEAKYGDQALFDRWMGDERLEKDDVIFTTEAPLGNIAQVPDNDGYILNQRVVVFKTSPNNLDNNFLATLLSSPLFQDKLQANSSGGTAKGIGMKEFAKIAAMLPIDIAEQKKIGLFFNNLDELITLHQRKLNHLQDKKKSLLQKIFPKNGEDFPELRFTEFTDPWEQRKLKQLANFAKGQGYSKNDLTDVGTPIILYGRLYTKYQSIISEVDTFAIPQSGSVYSTGEEVIVPASGETAEDIARASAIVKSGFLLGGDLNVIYPNKDISTIFLALSISNGKQQKELSKKAQGKSVVHLHNSDLEDVTISFPCREEQERIGSLFAHLDNLIILHQRKLNYLKEQKKALLQQMFV